MSDFAAALDQPQVESVDEQVDDRGTYLEVIRPGPGSADDDAQVEQRDQNRQLAATYSTIAAVPLVARDEAYGSLVLYYRAPHAYGADQVDLSQAFAQQAALAIENARLRAEAEQRLLEIERRQRVAEALRDLLEVVNSNHDLDEILAEVLAQSSRLLGNDASAVYLRVDDQTDISRARAALGLEPDNLAAEVRLGSPTTGLAVQQGRTLVCYDLLSALADDVLPSAETRLAEMGGYARVARMGARTDPDLELARSSSEPRIRRLVAQFRAVASTPLIARGRAFGAITLFYADRKRASARRSRAAHDRE